MRIKQTSYLTPLPCIYRIIDRKEIVQWNKRSGNSLCVSDIEEVCPPFPPPTTEHVYITYVSHLNGDSYISCVERLTLSLHLKGSRLACSELYLCHREKKWLHCPLYLTLDTLGPRSFASWSIYLLYSSSWSLRTPVQHITPCRARFITSIGTREEPLQAVGVPKSHAIESLEHQYQQLCTMTCMEGPGHMVTVKTDSWGTLMAFCLIYFMNLIFCVMSVFVFFELWQCAWWRWQQVWYPASATRLFTNVLIFLKATFSMSHFYNLFFCHLFSPQTYLYFGWMRNFIWLILLSVFCVFKGFRWNDYVETQSVNNITC